MLLVNLWDQEFTHSLNEQGFDAASFQVKPELIEYVRNKEEWDGITLFTNRCLEKVNSVKSKIKVAWMLEARVIIPESYTKLLELEDKFDYIITYYEDLLCNDTKKYIPYIMGCCRILPKDQQVYPKTKLVSHLVTRQANTEAHRFRHHLATFLRGQSLPITIFGPNDTPYPTKLEAHKEFMFSIIIMNSSENFFITEWVIDCFLCGTIPIFFGCPDIGFFFNLDGIIQIENLADTLSILPSLTSELYTLKLEAVKDNFQKAKAFMCPDDMIAKQLLKISI